MKSDIELIPVNGKPGRKFYLTESELKNICTLRKEQYEYGVTIYRDIDVYRFDSFLITAEEVHMIISESLTIENLKDNYEI